jgi:hypothetical protein
VIDNIIAYTSEEKATRLAAVQVCLPVLLQSGGISNNIILGALALVMAML